MLIRSPQPLSLRSTSNASVFIAGGISNCRDWQAEIVDIIDCDEFDVFNPRREGDFAKVGQAAVDQITWEHEALATCNHVLFWFPDSSICPITLFEYGAMLARASRHEISIVMGRDPDYERAFDLDVQTQLTIEHSQDANISVAHDYDEFCAMVDLCFGSIVITVEP